MVVAAKVLTWITIVLLAILSFIYLILAFIAPSEATLILIMAALIIGALMIVPIITLKKIKKCEDLGRKDDSMTVMGVLNIVFGNTIAGILLLCTDDSHYRKNDDYYTVNAIKQKYCSQCGTPMSMESKFCPNCGATQENNEQRRF